MEFKNILQRLDYYAKEKGLNDNKITTEAGLSVGLLGKLRKKGKGGLNSDSIEKILHTYIDLSAEWLLTGKGLMISKNEIRIPESEPAPEGLVKNLLDMIERKDQKIIDQAEEIGKLKNEVSILKKQGKSTNYLSVAEP